MKLTGLFVLFALLVSPGGSRPTVESQSSLRRELRRMVGYTIMASDGVAESFDSGGAKYVRLYSGQTFRIDGYAFVASGADVVVFAKAFPANPQMQNPATTTSRFYSYKLLIDSDIVDATLR